MPREAAVREARRRLHGAGPPRRAPLRVIDVALFYGERGGAIRTYLEAKAAWARHSGLIEHHVVVPGRAERHEGDRHEVRSLRLAAANGPRLPMGAGALKATLRALRPDVVVLHDPFWRPLGVTQTAHELGARVVAVHHGSTSLDAAGLPGPDALWHGVPRAWMHRAYRDADAIMSAVDPRPDCGRSAEIPLRFGIDAVFAPQPDVRRQDHVLYVGRLGREKGVIELLHAAARSSEPWPLKIVGSGPLDRRLQRLAARLGIADRVRLYPFIADRRRLAHWYASARVVAMPGARETFGLTAFEAAATGTPVVTCATAPSAALMRTIAHTYEPGDIDGLPQRSRRRAQRDPPRRPARRSVRAARGARRSPPRRCRSSGSYTAARAGWRSSADPRRRRAARA